jgi:general secretion pathway protein G
MTNEQRKKQAGFTLIELLLVLVILGTLAAIVIPKFTGRTEQARITAAKTQISNFETALEAYEADNGSYPRGTGGLSDLVEQPKDAPNWKGPYLKSIPLDPWQHAYVYECPGRRNASSYDIMSMGPEGRTSGEGIIANWDTSKH